MREASGYLRVSLYWCPEELTTLTKTLSMERAILQLIAAEKQNHFFLLRKVEFILLPAKEL